MAAFAHRTEAWCQWPYDLIVRRSPSWAFVEKERRIEAELAEKRGKLEERRKLFGE